MIHCYAIDGYSASVRNRPQLSDVVTLSTYKMNVRAESMLHFHKSLLFFGSMLERRIVKDIRSKGFTESSLMLIGKSLGARNVVNIVNRLYKGLRSFRDVGIVLIDPCWPTNWSLRPNLNDETLTIRAPVRHVTCVKLIAPKGVQAGSGVEVFPDEYGLIPEVRTIEVKYSSDVNHKSIVSHIETLSAICKMFRVLDDQQ